jgi:hypothetical protein
MTPVTFEWYNSRPSYGSPPRTTPDEDSHKTASQFPRPLLLKPYRDSWIFCQWATWPRPRILFLPPRFWKVLENTRMFSPGLKLPRARTISCLHVTKSYQKLLSEVIYLAGQGQLRVYLPFECNELSDPFLACHNKRPFQRTVNPPERLVFNISTYSLRTKQ